ncbi:MAG: hypothetical protein ACFE0R_11015 [Salinarimonas sp.]
MVFRGDPPAIRRAALNPLLRACYAVPVAACKSLTFMPTLLTLEKRGDIVRLDADLGPRQQAFRRLFVAPTVAQWLQRDLGGRDTSVIGNALSPLEQIDSLFERFVSGRALDHGRQFKCLRPAEKAVWELKTDDVRIFGFFTERDCFVALFANFTDTVKDYGLYRGYVDEVVRVRTALAIDGGHVEGSDPDDVVSIAAAS